ncbi:MAG TPA: right-handed parallel beta-helix repeat-containing protein [Longimicrobium sp.]|nr:right-handed parallel beta-helix repeat-containing protein [Longimicrobium sp.]
MQTRRNPRLRLAAVLLSAAGVLGACDTPTATERALAAAADDPSLLISPACAGTAGQTHTVEMISAPETWTRANSPHRVSLDLIVTATGRITIAPGAVVCFGPEASLSLRGGRVIARGLDTARIVFTAQDLARGWRGLHFQGAPAAPSYLTNVRIEHLHYWSTAVSSQEAHPVYVDSAVIRQSGRAAWLTAPGSRLSRSRVDTTTDYAYAAVELGDRTRFEETVIRGAAGVGLQVSGGGVLLLGGRIEGSESIGLWYTSDAPLGAYARPLRIVGGRDRPLQVPVSVLARLYGTPALQDSLLGNARDTVLVNGGMLRRASLTVGPRVPVQIEQAVFVDSAASIVAQPGASIRFGPNGGLRLTNGGRLWSRGTAASPVLLTATIPARGWDGLEFLGLVPSTSYLTNTRIEHVRVDGTAVYAADNHRVLVDSSVIRMSGSAVVLLSPNSRLMRSRVDTTLTREVAAVRLGSNARLESTRIHTAAGPGLIIRDSTVQVVSCEIRDGESHGILILAGTPVHNCNLVNNAGLGILTSTSSPTANVTGNWWGSPGGPNVTGGDGAQGQLTVSPWRTTPFVLPYLP